MHTRTAVAITLLLAASVAAVATASAAPAAATLPAATAPYRIGFVEPTVGNPNLYAIFSAAADGTGGVQNTNAAQNVDDIAPAYSPDGTQLAYAELPAGSTNRAIMVANADGSSPRALTTPTGSETDSDPSWSPDGSMIVFDRQAAPSFDEGPSTFQIYIVVVATGQVIGPLLPPGWAEFYDPAWSPTDAGTIVASGAQNGSSDHILVRLSVVVSGGSATVDGAVPLTNSGSCEPPSQINDLQVADTESTQDINPAFSPDGGTVAYVSNFSPVGFFCLVNIDGTQPRPVAVSNINPQPDQQLRLSHPAFSPDGAVVAIQATVLVNRLGQPEILAVTLNAPPATATSGTEEEWIAGAASPAFDVKSGPVSLTVVATPTPGYVGGAPIAVAYTLNNGSARTISAAQLRAVLPATLPLLATSRAGCTPAACALGDVPAGGAATVTFTLGPKIAISSLATGAVTFLAAGGGQTAITGQGPVVVIAPALTLNPEVGPAGFVTVATGLGFPPSAVIRFHWDAGITAPTKVKAKADGTFTVQMLVLPNDLIGGRNLVAHGISGPAFGDVTAPFLVELGSPQPPRLIGRN